MFVLRTINEKEFAACLTRWRQSGLPTPTWFKQRYGRPGQPLWMNCPFLPHVGNGEVAIDLACHARNALSGE